MSIIEIDSARNSSACKSHICLRPLSPREALMVEMCKDYTNREIAEDLYISVHTVRATLRTAFMKLGANTRAQAYWEWRQIAAVRSGLVLQSSEDEAAAYRRAA